MSTFEEEPDNPLLCQADVLEEEFFKLNPKVPRPEHKKGATEEERLAAIYKSIHDQPLQRSALCLSGGGIRSATFCLGVLQGLARCNMLGKFDYLSTVSGGGYIGSWLTAWIHRDGSQKVMNALRDKPTSKITPEPKQISHLRSYSNYLSPKVGAFSVDTWTLLAIYLRNLFLNWLVFVPLLLAVLIAPRLYVWAIRLKPLTAPNNAFLYISLVLLGLGIVLGSIALAYIASHRPSIRRARNSLRGPVADASGDSRHTKKPGDPVKEQSSDPDNNLGNFFRRCMIPLIGSVILLTIGRAWYLNSGASRFGLLHNFVAFGALLHLSAWILYARLLPDWPHRLRELFVVLVTGALGGVFLWLLLIPANMLKIYEAGNLPSDRPEIFACLDGPLLMMVFFFMGVLSIGIGSHSIDDEDREWWARAGAWVLLAIVFWALFNLLVIYGPQLLIYALKGFEQRDWGSLQNKLTNLVVLLGLVSGFITILFGLSSKTPATVNPLDKAGRLTLIMDYAVKMAAPLFALFLVMVLSLLTDVLILMIRIVPRIYSQPVQSWDFYPNLAYLSRIPDSSFWELSGLFAAMLLIGWFMAKRIDINDFSLHSMYRNRLIRAYLGASHQRDAQPFTGFDRNDDLKMSDLWPNRRPTSQKPGKPLFHILNMTWNLVGGKNLAWQNRKAVSFTVSPLHCGNARYGYRKTDTYGGDPDTLTLGTALTISGAAASPNMGYHSSPSITFLMTLFNARLGWWLGNPKHDKYYRRSGPKVAVWPMFEEAFGLTDEEKRYTYLSDGGHFENLGLYEMVLRRCHYIFVVDASRDPDYKFENLGNAIRTIRVDLGVTIEIGNIFMYPRNASKPNAYCALGQILYSRMGESSDGLLVYIKPAIAGGEPTDVFNYAQNRDFPHESTSDQWFSEQQFESYRMLGLHAIEQIFPLDRGEVPPRKDTWSDKKDFCDLEAHIKNKLEAFKINA